MGWSRGNSDVGLAGGHEYSGLNCSRLSDPKKPGSAGKTEKGVSSPATANRLAMLERLRELSRAKSRSSAETESEAKAEPEPEAKADMGPSSNHSTQEFGDGASSKQTSVALPDAQPDDAQRTSRNLAEFADVAEFSEVARTPAPLPPAPAGRGRDTWFDQQPTNLASPPDLSTPEEFDSSSRFSAVGFGGKTERLPDFSDSPKQVARERRAVEETVAESASDPQSSQYVASRELDVYQGQSNWRTWLGVVSTHPLARHRAVLASACFALGVLVGGLIWGRHPVAKPVARDVASAAHQEDSQQAYRVDHNNDSGNDLGARKISGLDAAVAGMAQTPTGSDGSIAPDAAPAAIAALEIVIGAGLDAAAADAAPEPAIVVTPEPAPAPVGAVQAPLPVSPPASDTEAGTVITAKSQRTTRSKQRRSRRNQRPMKCSFQVTSAPSGAPLTVDGKSVGRTPKLISAVPCGRKVSVGIRQAKYRQFLRTFVPTKRGRQRIHAKLKRPFAKLTVVTRPPGALVKVAGSKAKRSPASFKILQFAKIKVMISKRGYKTRKTTAYSEGAAVRLALRLEKL